MNETNGNNTSPSLVNPNDITIEIHRTPPIDVNPTNPEEGHISPANTTMPQNFISFISHARGEFERHAELTRSWRVNLNNVFQGVRPLVQQAQNANNLRNWMPQSGNFRFTPLTNQIGSRTAGIQQQQPSASTSNQSNDSVTINLNTDDFNNPFHHSHHHHHHHHYHPNPLLETNETIASTSNNINREANTHRTSNTTANMQRRIQERVAALTRDDPPNLLERPNNHRHNHNHNRNNVNDDEGAVAEVFAQIPEARNVLKNLARYIPFICILLAKSSYDHFESIIDLSALLFIFTHANSVVREQISQHSQRRIAILFRELLAVAAFMTFRLPFLEKKSIFTRLILAVPYYEPITLSRLLFSVAVTDLMLMIITVSIKLLIIMLPARVLKYKGRGRIYLLIESLSQMYRAIVPMRPWLFYLLESYTGIEKILGVLFAGAYIVSKGFDLVDRAKFCKRSFTVFLRKVKYGKAPTKQELQTAGSQCPICHDGYDTPVVLECGHIFCELCIGTWFSRKQTCPLCRAKVADDPSWQDGATTFFLQLY